MINIEIIRITNRIMRNAWNENTLCVRSSTLLVAGRETIPLPCFAIKNIFQSIGRHICVETSPCDVTESFPQRVMSSVITFDLIRGTVTVLVSDNMPLIDWWHLKCQCVTETRAHFSTIQPTASRWDYRGRGEKGYFNWMENCARFSNSPITMTLTISILSENNNLIIW